MRRVFRRCTALVVVFAFTLVPTHSEAIAPALLLILKQLAQNVAQSMLKDALLSGLSGMGCKGIALANALDALDLRRGVGGLGGMPNLSGLAGVRAMPNPASMPNLPKMPNLPGMPALPGMASLSAMTGGLGGGVQSDMTARMSALMPGLGQMPAGAGLAPDQMAMLESVQQAMGRPLSPGETIAAIDDLAELGFLPKAVQTELKQCMVALPASIPALGMGMAMLQPIVPQLRKARAELQALSPAEQDEVAATLAEEIGPLPAEQRAEFIEYLGTGFFPARISAGVKARLGVK